MPTIVVRPVGMFKAKFQGVEPCKNPQYANVLLGLEYDRDEEFKAEKHLHEVNEVMKFKHLIVGKEYWFKCAIGINGESEKEGRRYPARLNLRVLEAKELT